MTNRRTYLTNDDLAKLRRALDAAKLNDCHLETLTADEHARLYLDTWIVAPLSTVIARFDRKPGNGRR